MIINVLSDFRSNTSVNKLEGNNYLFVEYKCPIDIEKFRLLTDYHLISFVVTGKKDWMTGEKTYRVQEGDAAFIRKGVYTTRQYQDVDYCVLLFFINDDFIRSFMKDNKYEPAMQGGEATHDQIFRIDTDEPLRTLFHSMFNYLKMAPAIPRNLVEIKFKELLFNILINPQNKQLAQFFASLSITGNRSLESVMTENFRYDLQLKDFARLCGRSLSAFKRDFKTFYEETPGKWLTSRRLEYARDLLLTSSFNISEVCYESGFKNVSHFNKAFRDKYSLPPRQYRQHTLAGARVTQPVFSDAEMV